MENKMNELLKEIENSSEYKEYKRIGNILCNDSNIGILMQDIKELQKEASLMEANNDIRYKEIEKIILEKVDELNNNKDYKKYLEEINKFNYN